MYRTQLEELPLLISDWYQIYVRTYASSIAPLRLQAWTEFQAYWKMYLMLVTGLIKFLFKQDIRLESRLSKIVNLTSRRPKVFLIQPIRRFNIGLHDAEQIFFNVFCKQMQHITSPNSLPLFVKWLKWWKIAHREFKKTTVTVGLKAYWC